MDNMKSMMPCMRNDSDFEIGMAYVPWQKMNQLYEPAKALMAGSLFPELEKPFYGSSAARKVVRR